MEYMSSESDADEFYDAEEASPARGVRKDSRKTQDAEDPSVDLEEEEKKILKQMELAEERRKREDEDLQTQLTDLSRRKEEEHQKVEAKKKAIENEKRRRKLEEMRHMVEDDTTPRKPPPKPPRLHLEEENQVEAEQGQGHSTQTAPISTQNTQLENVDKSGNSNIDNEKVDVADGQYLSLGLDSEQNIIDTGKETSQNMINERNESLNLNKSVKEEVEKVHSKNIPELICDEADQKQDSDSPYEGNVEDLITPTIKEPEPDIIQSTKNRSTEMGAPVAPPRRKRKPKAPATPTESLEVPVTSATPAGLPTDLQTPTSTVYSLTKDLEQSLDIHSATSGSRMVTASEDASAKAESHKEHEEESPGNTTESKSHAKSPTEGSQKVKSDKTVPPCGKDEMWKLGGDEDVVPMQRPRSNSGRLLTDKEILDGVLVLNLDTGESIPLSLAEDKLPKCVNPLSLHIMRRTKEYSSDSSLHKELHRDSDDDSKSGGSHTTKTLRSVRPLKGKGTKFKRFIGKSVRKLKSVADEVLHGEDSGGESDDDEFMDGRRMIKIKASSAHKGPYDFDLLVPVQDIAGHAGAVWSMKASPCGKLLATGGQDNLLRIWVLKEAYAYFDDMRQKYSEAAKVSPTPSQDSLNSQAEAASSETSSLSEEHELAQAGGQEEEEDAHAPFMRKPFCIYKGHAADLLDLAWSKNYFILSSSMDKTVRLWHISRRECLCCFQHIDFVTAIAFHPRDDRYFLSGSLDGKLRLWNIPEKKVALWNEVHGGHNLITAANFCLNGRFAVVGTYDGRCIFYSTDKLKYFTQIHVRSTRGKNARGRKVTGVESMPGEDKILVTSNDSRIRLYDLRDLTLTCKYKGCANNSSQIKASFSHNGKYIICGSEDHFAYIWRTQHEFYKFSSARRDRNDYWEGIKAHAAVVTVAIFAPNPGLIIRPQFESFESDGKKAEQPEVRGEVLLTVDFAGAIKVFINKFKPGSG